MGKEYHILPDGNRWAVKRSGGKRAGSVHGTQREAIEAAIPRARRISGEVVIHRPDGRIRDKDSYGHDPFPPRDKKH